MSLTNTIFTYLGDWLVKIPVKVCVWVFATIMLTISIYGITLLETDFNIIWFMAPGSYLRK